MIKSDEFREQLIKTHCYRTPEAQKLAFMDVLVGRSNLRYKCGIMGVVLRGGRLARSGRWNRDTWLDLSLDIWRTVEGCLGTMEVSGCEHLAALKGPAVIVANHMSLLETFAIPAMVLPFQHMTFVVKESLMHIPLFKDVMKGTAPISVGRKNPRDDLKTLMEEGPKVLNGGRCLVVFPQATRNPVLKPKEFNTVGAKLAKRAGVPVLPLALKTDFHGIGKVVRDFGRIDRSKSVHFKFGPAIEVSGNGRDAHEATLRFIGETLESWGGTVDRS
jgi:1-acyl-sn-glycerol-3-phosphate acyltransferase